MIPPPLKEKYRTLGYWGPETIPARFWRVCEENASRIAIIDGRRSLSFAVVVELASRLAGQFTALGAGPGVVVSWQLPGWWESVVVHHAALLCGAIPNPLNPIFRVRDLRFILEEARPRILVVPQSFRGFDHATLATELRARVSSIEHIIVVRGGAPGALSLEHLLEEDTASFETPAHPSVTALLLYTSGTTADPKGVLHTHETLLYEIDSLRDVHELKSSDRYLAGSPVAHIAGLVYGVLMPFALGTSTVLMERWDAAAAMRLVSEHRATFQTGAPAFLLQLAEHAGAADGSSFRLFSTGGASIPTASVADAAARLGCIVKRAYGSTEVPTLTATRYTDPEEIRVGSDGRVISPAEMRIVDGEIWARSPELFLGYLNPELNAASFDDEGWFRTGDLGSIDTDGNLRVTGRLKDIIIRGGENISAKEIEDLLLTHPAVLEAAVVGLPDPILGERACAVVVLRQGSAFSFDEMVAFLAAHELAKQKFPERLEIRLELPRTASGKVLKAEIRQELG
ncbi:MAG: AMP-binding protein [Actinobacteria bacterium]|nr:AMP-binding protein [Actinomycetota bacterium]